MKPTLLLMMLLSIACVASNKGARPDIDGEEVAIKKAPPEAVKLAAKNGLPDPNELICTYEKDTGSNIPEKTCKTRWQIEQQRREAQDFMEVRGKSCGNNKSGGCSN